MRHIIGAAVIAALLSTSALAQPPETQPGIQPVPAVAHTEVMETELPANTEVLLSMNTELTSTTHRAGDSFSMSVASDVRIGNHVVIPRGTRAVGEVTWRTGRGAFGKSGKMRISLRYLDLNGTRVPIEGDYYQEGEGSTLATVGGVILVGVFAGFITGSRARIPAGRELSARTAVSIPFEAGANGVQIAPRFGALVDTWRAAQESTPEAICRREAQARGGRPDRVADRTQECLQRSARSAQAAAR